MSSVGLDRVTKNKGVKYELKTNISSTLPYYSNPSFELSFPIDPKNINKDKIKLIEKTDTIFKNMPFNLSVRNQLTTSFAIEAELKPETNYTLTIDKGTFTSGSERSNDSITYKFKTTSIDDYAQLNMKLFFPKKENYIIMLLNEKEQLVNESFVEFSLNSTSEKIIAYKNLIPGNYFINIVEDVNKNRLFDMGDYFLNKQPETIFVNANSNKIISRLGN